MLSAKDINMYNFVLIYGVMYLIMLLTIWISSNNNDNFNMKLFCQPKSTPDHRENAWYYPNTCPAPDAELNLWKVGNGSPQECLNIFAPFFFPSTLTSITVSADKNHHHIMILPPLCFNLRFGIVSMMRGVRFE